MICLDAPVFLNDNDLHVQVIGWCNAESRPSFVNVRVAGINHPAAVAPAPAVDRLYPALKASAYQVSLDFRAIYRNPEAAFSQDMFSVVLDIEAADERRGFELTPSPAWVEHVFDGAGPKPVIKPVTPDHLMVRVSGSHDISFYPSGHIILNQIRSLLKQCGRDLSEFQSILDFGCGCARVLLALHREGVSARLFGSDIDGEAIAWCVRNLGAVATFEANDPLPPIRYADNTFDLVYAVSVFTHLPEDHQDAWLAELRRILKPGGLLITTVHGPRTRRELPRPVQREVRKRGFLYVDQTNPDWPKYLGAKTQGLPDFYRLTYHTFAYVRARWSEYFEILLIKNQGLNYLQDAVVCRKPLFERNTLRHWLTTMKARIFFSLSVIWFTFIGCARRPAPPDSSEPTSDRKVQKELPAPAAGASAAMQKLPGMPTFNVDQIQTQFAPFTKPDEPIPVTRGDALMLVGWAVDEPSKKAATGIDVTIDGTAYHAEYGYERPEIAAYFKAPAYLKSGFKLQMGTNSLNSGPHTLTIRVLSAGQSGYYESPALHLAVR